jgi:hypothetical protein
MKHLAPDMNSLDGIEHFFSPLHPINPTLRVRPDYIIESPVGCFRIAYSRKHHAAALFFARHPNDLAGKIDEQSGVEGGEIGYKDRIYLIKLCHVDHPVGAKWSPPNQRQHLGLPWIAGIIPQIVSDLPGILLKEATLHRQGMNSYASAFVGYQGVAKDYHSNGYSEIAIVTKTKNNRQIPSFLRYHLSSLRVTNQDGSILFRDPEIPAAIEHDFFVRLREIWEGKDPLCWKELRLLPLVRANELLNQKIEIISSFLRSGCQLTYRDYTVVFKSLLNAVLDSQSVVTDTALDLLLKMGDKEELGVVPRDWEGFVSPHARRLLTIESKLHKLLVRPDPEGYQDLEWLSPDKQTPNFIVNGVITDADPSRTFRNWLASHFIGPYACIFEYFGHAGEIIDFHEIEKTVAVHAKTSNGLEMYYIPETQKMFAYYHMTGPSGIPRHLPPDAPEFFAPDTVLTLNLKLSDSPIEKVAFSQFQSYITSLLSAPSLRLPSADQPEGCAINCAAKSPSFKPLALPAVSPNPT